jgi:hypothetical protein
MSRRGADEISGSEELQRRLLAHRGPSQISALERDRLIVELDGRGWSHDRIGRAVGMTRRGVGLALQRIREGRPGRIRAE